MLQWLKTAMFNGMNSLRIQLKLNNGHHWCMNGRDAAQKVAATRMDVGSDVNYGSITTQLVDHLKKKSNFQITNID